MLESVMDFIGGSLFEAVSSLAVLLITILLGYLSRWAKRQTEKVENETWQKTLSFAIMELHNATAQAVKVVQETYVEKRKEADEWDDEAKRAALEKAKAKVWNLMSDASIAILKEVWGNFEEWTEDFIEGKVADQKKSNDYHASLYQGAQNIPQ